MNLEMNLVLIIGIALILLIVYLVVDWLAGVNVIFLEKQIRRAMELMELEEEQKKREIEYAKFITLEDLDNYIELHEKIAGKKPEVIKMTEQQFDKFESLMSWRYGRFIVDYVSMEHYNGIPIKVIKYKEEK